MNTRTRLTLITLVLLTALLAACDGGTTPSGPSPSATPVETPPVQGPTAAPAETEPDLPPATEEETPSEQETAPPGGPLEITSESLDITSDGVAYHSYVAAPTSGGPYPGIVLIHSINGMQQGYFTITDRLAEQGFVVLALGWQTERRDPEDAVVAQLVTDGIAYLGSRGDVDMQRLGLTGFCIGGYYTMLFMPQFDNFKAGVAWYGFPYRGNPQPASLIGDLNAPLLIIHGTEDRPSPIDDIYRYTDELTQAGKTFELKVYEGEPHGFMLAGEQMREDDVAMDAFMAMVDFFRRTLG